MPRRRPWPPSRARGTSSQSQRCDPATFETYYGQWAGSLMRGEYALSQELRRYSCAKRKAQRGYPKQQRPSHAWANVSLARPFRRSASAFHEALQICDQQLGPGRTIFHLVSTPARAAVYLAHANGYLASSAGCENCWKRRVARAIQLGHVPTLATLYTFKRCSKYFAAMPKPRADGASLHLSKQHELPTFLALGSMPRGWSRARLGDSDVGMAPNCAMASPPTSAREQAFVPFFQGLLAEARSRGPTSRSCAPYGRSTCACRRDGRTRD